VDAGTSVSFNVAALNGPFTYQWQFNSADIPGATAFTYSILNTGPGDAGVYRVTVSNTSGSTLSGPAQLTINTNPQVVASFVGEIIDPGTNFTLTGQTTGGRP